MEFAAAFTTGFRNKLLRSLVSLSCVKQKFEENTLKKHTGLLFEMN